MSYGFSPKLPLKYGTEDGPYKNLKTISEIGHQNLKMIVLTIPGERVMDPFFGVGISQYLFEQEGSIGEGFIEQKILSQVEKYIPYVKITNIEISKKEIDRNFIGMKIEYFIENFSTNEVLYLNLSKNGSDSI